VRRLAAAVTFACAVFAVVCPASAVVVNPFFGGHGTIDRTTPDYLWTIGDAGLTPIFGQSLIYIDPVHGFVSDGGGFGEPAQPGNWDYDMDIWGPLVSNMDLSYGGQVTYGFPVAGVFAVSWVNMVNADDHSVFNTFQVLFIGASGFTTNAGFAIAPGSVVFSYGAQGNAAGTVNITASSPETIGILLRGRVSTLQSLGVGDANGVISTADLAALRASGDPFLFNSNGAGGFDTPIAFTSVVGLVPEPAGGALLALALGGLLALRRPAAR